MALALTLWGHVMLVTALKSFDHNGRRSKGTSFEVSEMHAQALKRAKLVAFKEEEAKNPILTDCILPSALHPVPALPQTTANLSEDGNSNEKKKPGRKKKQP